ncbi:MAG: phosphate signaling complex protein PhoU [Zoogloeaceae bacterium]|jgi:phosphate transport system protein|nr:phosphate signaling complex protein PhoU [Zoogloeaceae bacterium]
MRARFDEQLTELNNELIAMGMLIEEAIRDATRALETRDAALARQVAGNDRAINEKEREIESLCLKLLLMQQPVARDLRQISAALKMIADLERIGDNAANISEMGEYLADQPYIKELEIIPKMAKATSRMVTGSIDAFVKKDIGLAQAVIAQDDEVDALYAQTRRELIALVHENVENGEGAFDLLQIAKYFERIGVHAENVAEWVIFSITGKHKNRQVL